MAFKILSEEQINRLTPQQRENYLAAQEKYYEREKFVKKAEQQRNIKVSEYKMKKRPIKPIGHAVSPFIKFDGFCVQLGEESDKIFNTIKQTGNRVERLGKQRSFTPVTARVPGVRVAAVKRIQINPREKIGVKLNRVPLAVPNQNKFNFNKPTVSVNKVISGSAPQINTMQRKTQVNIKKLPGVKLPTVKHKNALPLKREKPMLPNMVLSPVADIQCEFKKPHLTAVKIDRVKKPVVNPATIQKHIVQAIEKTVAIPTNVTVKKPIWATPNLRGTVSVCSADSISAKKPELKKICLNHHKQVNVPVISFDAEKQAPMVKDIPSVSIISMTQNISPIKKPAVSQLPDVRVIKPKKIAVPEISTGKIKTEGIVFNATEINYHPIKTPCLQTKNNCPLVIPKTIDQSAELKKILGITG
ncbi:MAG: hypothetical protein U0K87_12010 [Ruminococcus sp.]|nr:hypothetical protein [Ruminococcus sp.]